MGLICWLPLMGTLENKGISNITVINNGATVDTNGKIGSCYSFNGNNYYISLVGQQLFDCFKGENQQFSICMWVYHADSRRAVLFGDWSLSNSIGFNIELSTGHGVRFYWNGSPDYSPGINVGSSIWNHITFTYDGTALRSYLNGNLIATRSGALAARSKTAGEFRLGRDNRTTETALNGKLNDVRIYKDHCLSAAEVREISQGLVLHYKLDSIGPSFGNPNLLLKGTTPTAAGNGATGVVRSIENGIQKVVADNPNGNWCTFGNHNTTLSLTKGDTFTFSLMIRSPDSNKKPTVYFQSGLGYYSMQGTMSNNWSIIYYTGTWSIDNLQTNIHLGFSSAPGTYYIKYFKLEKGNSVTPWAPKEGEPLSNLKYIEDNSGYNHNAISNGSQPISVDTDTPKYSYSTKFISGSRIAMPVASSTCLPTTAITVSIWYKSTGGTARFLSCTESGGWNFEVNSSKASFPFYIKGKGYGRVIATKNFYSDNQWHMITASYNGINTAKIYLDGELDNSATITSGWENLPIAYNSSTPLTLGAEAQTIASPIAGTYVGNLSDLRIYCTALSDDDILQLYHTGAKVDNKQNWHTFEFKETNSNLFAGKLWTSRYSSKNPTTAPFTNFNSQGEYQFTSNSTSAGSEYITINPTGHTYEYDYTISVNAGNQFYIGFERYDANKTARSNNACTYTYATKPSTNVVKQHFTGTVNLSTDGTNPCKYIALRILNGWSGTTSGVTGTATIHSFSLREISTKQKQEITKTGQTIEEEINECGNAKIYKNGIIGAAEFIEI